MALGREGWGYVHPNPLVGCVLVKDGVVVGEGHHERFGGAHAEVNAIARAGEKARGATAFVSLEPCNHAGKTPPCSKALLAAGITRVVFAAPDPGRTSGGGGAALREAGLDVTGPTQKEADYRRENPAFFFNAEHNASYVALKLAQSLDGFIAAAPGKKTLITGEEAHLETHRLRAGFDAVLVGSGTALVDDPRLTVRLPGQDPKAGGAYNALPSPRRTRIILDSDARLSPGARVFADVSDSPVLVFTSEDAPEGARKGLESAGATVVPVPGGPGGLSLEAAIGSCWEMGIRSIFCEGGGRLGSALLVGGFARRLYLFVAPFVLGEGAVPGLPNLDSRELWDAWDPAFPPQLFGRDVLLTFDRTD